MAGCIWLNLTPPLQVHLNIQPKNPRRAIPSLLGNIQRKIIKKNPRRARMLHIIVNAPQGTPPQEALK